MTELTERQRQLFKAFQDLIHDNGTPPTVRELQRELGIKSPNGIVGHIRALIKKGVLKRIGKKNAARSVVPVEGDWSRCPTCCRPFLKG